MSWFAPTDNGFAVTDYDVQYRKCTATPKSCDTNPTWGSWSSKSFTGTGTNTTITGLTNGTAYQVQVRATNSKGTGPWSTSAKATPSGKPSKPSTPTVTVGDTQLTVTWTAASDNGSEITRYDVYYCDNTDTNSPCSDDANWYDSGHSDTTLSATISSLTNGTAYKVRVRGVNNNGDGPWSSSVTRTPAGAPSAPESLEFVSGGGFLTVSWTTAANGSTISGHDIRYCNTNDSNKDCYSDYDDWTTTSVSGTTTYKKISGLTNGDSYDVEVRAKEQPGQQQLVEFVTGHTGRPVQADPRHDHRRRRPVHRQLDRRKQQRRRHHLLRGLVLQQDQTATAPPAHGLQKAITTQPRSVLSSTGTTPPSTRSACAPRTAAA